MVWVTFALCLLIGMALLLLPGLFVVKAMSADTATAFCLAPAISVGLYNCLAVLYGVCGVPFGVTSAVLPIMALAVVLYIAASRGGRPRNPLLCVSDTLHAPSGGAVSLSVAGLSALLAIVVGLVISVAVYLCKLSTPDTFLANYDSAFHLTRLRKFAETGVCSSLSGGFYPSAWHCLGALILSATGCGTAVAAQASTFAFVILVFPVGMNLMLSTLFPDNPRRVLLGSLFCLCTWFFPWRILLFGPLYPNVASFSLMPAALALFIRLTGDMGTAKNRFGSGLLFCLAFVALVFAQPNTVFFSAIFILPYLMFRIRQAVSKKVGDKKGRMLALFGEFAFLVFFVLTWAAAMSLPFMRPLVAYERDQPLSLFTALRRLLTFQFIHHLPQFALFLLLLAGGFKLLLGERTRWIAFSYGAIGFVFMASVGLSGPIRGIISGFCYNDYYRTAACACIASVPLIAAGADCLFDFLFDACRRVRGHSVSRATRYVLATVVLAAICAVNYFPNVGVERFASLGFEFIAKCVFNDYNNDGAKCYSSEERAFVAESREICGDELVVNQPFDGSVFSYALDGMNVMFPRFGFNQNSDEILLMQRLASVSSDDSVVSAVRRLRARYVLQLDQGDGETGMNAERTMYPLGYNPEEWLGINGIRDDTQGFKVLLSKGDMRLYKICVDE